MNLLEFSLNKEKAKLFLAYLTLLDILVLPYLQVMIMPMSLPFILAVFVLGDIKIKNDWDFKMFFGLALCVLISNIFSILIPKFQPFFFDNIKYALQLIVTFFYFFYFKSLDNIDGKKIISIVNIFFLFILAIACYFMYNPLESMELIKTFYGRTTVSEEDFLFDFRFPYLFSDPNSAAYFTLMTFGFFLHNYKSALNLFLVFLIVLTVVLLTQSAGAFAAFVIMSSVFFIKMFKFKIRYVLIAIVLFLCLGLLISKLIENKNQLFLVESVYDRVFDSSERIDSGGGRLDKWEELFSMYPLPFGRGYTLFDEGRKHGPHSDFFGLIYRYGFISLFLFIAFLYKHFKGNAYVYIPALVCMGINSILDDQKLFGLFLVLIVINNKLMVKENA